MLRPAGSYWGYTDYDTAASAGFFLLVSFRALLSTTWVTVPTGTDHARVFIYKKGTPDTTHSQPRQERRKGQSGFSFITKRVFTGKVMRFTTTRAELKEAQAAMAFARPNLSVLMPASAGASSESGDERFVRETHIFGSEEELQRTVQEARSCASAVVDILREQCDDSSLRHLTYPYGTTAVAGTNDHASGFALVLQSTTSFTVHRIGAKLGQSHLDVDSNTPLMVLIVPATGALETCYHAPSNAQLLFDSSFHAET